MRLSKTLVFFLIFTVLASFLAYKMIIQNYEKWATARYDPFEDKQ